jgi:hypothetical protein
METQKASVKKIALNYGILLALLSIVLAVFSYVTDNHIDRPWWLSVISTLVMIAVIVYGLKAFKNDNGGFLSVGEAIKVGLAISLISGIIYAIYSYIFVTVIEPDFVNQMLVFTEEKMIEDNPEMTEAQLNMAMDMTEKFMSPMMMTAFAIIGSLFFGFIISLISGMILKQKRPEHL